MAKVEGLIKIGLFRNKLGPGGPSVPEAAVVLDSFKNLGLIGGYTCWTEQSRSPRSIPEVGAVDG